MSQGVYVLGSKCHGGKCPGGKCLGDICPITVLCNVLPPCSTSNHKHV